MAISATDWIQKTKADKRLILQQLISGRQTPDFIQLVTIDQMGVVASLGEHFGYAIFGRDSIRVAKDLMDTHPELAHTIVLTLARLQGTKSDDISEEEPGKIHHEYRNLIFEGKPVPNYSAAILHTLQMVWGGEGTGEMTYYGSIDATPLYIRLLQSYVRAYGAETLKETYTDRDGTTKSLLDSLGAAIDWLTRKLQESEWGLLEYKRRNPNGLANQVWKDSVTAYLHTDGSTANFDQGIASIELQGYAYDALVGASDLLRDDPRATVEWPAMAQKIQETTLDKFWMEDTVYFAEGLDRDDSGKMRQIKTLTSNPGLLLRSRLLQDLEPDSQKHYVDHIVQMLMGPEFLTDGGIRCRALRHKEFPGFPDYHGSFTTWPKETYEIAKGLYSHGYIDVAKDLDDRVLDAVARSGEFYEFFYVNDDGSIWNNTSDALNLLRRAFGGKTTLPIPEAGQAWTISAVLEILHHRQAPSS